MLEEHLHVGVDNVLPYPYNFVIALSFWAVIKARSINLERWLPTLEVQILISLAS